MFKVGDKVKPFRWPGDWEIVYIAENDPTPYLCVRNSNGILTTSWFRESEVAPKFKVNEVWETRDGEDTVIIVSVHNDSIIGIFDANTAIAASHVFTFDGRYDSYIEESPYDLVKKIS
jgi:hypothetical protein